MHRVMSSAARRWSARWSAGAQRRFASAGSGAGGPSETPRTQRNGLAVFGFVIGLGWAWTYQTVSSLPEQMQAVHDAVRAVHQADRLQRLHQEQGNSGGFSRVNDSVHFAEAERDAVYALNELTSALLLNGTLLDFSSALLWGQRQALEGRGEVWHCARKSKKVMRNVWLQSASKLLSWNTSVIVLPANRCH